MGELHSLVLLLFHDCGGGWDAPKILPGLILGSSLAMNILPDAPSLIDEYWLILFSEEEDSPRMSITCWIPTLLLFVLSFSSIKNFTIPSCQETMILSSSEDMFMGGIEFFFFLKLMLNVGGRVVD